MSNFVISPDKEKIDTGYHEGAEEGETGECQG